LALAMPTASQVPEVLVMIESIGSSAGVNFSTVSVGTPDGTQVPVTLTFSGNQDAVNHFLDAVNNNVRTATLKNQAVTTDATGVLNVTTQLGLSYQGGSN